MHSPYVRPPSRRGPIIRTDRCVTRGAPDGEYSAPLSHRSAAGRDGHDTPDNRIILRTRHDPVPPRVVADPPPAAPGYASGDHRAPCSEALILRCGNPA